MAELDFTEYTIQKLAALVILDWKKIDPYAGAYLEAMLHLQLISDKYGADDCDDICQRFLLNAGSWRGEMARNVKAELKRRINEFHKAKKKSRK